MLCRHTDRNSADDKQCELRRFVKLKNEWRCASASPSMDFMALLVESSVLECFILWKVDLVARVHTCSAQKVLCVGICSLGPTWL